MDIASAFVVTDTLTGEAWEQGFRADVVTSAMTKLLDAAISVAGGPASPRA